MNLTAERLNRGLSLAAAARVIGVHRNTLTALEAGARVHPESAKKIADYFGCKVTDLLPLDEAA
jgi:transcriptional regulator with XRE-family HTH domain